MQTSIELTATARRHAETRGILTVLQNTVPQADLMRGDIVEIASADEITAFVVRARRLQIRVGEEQVLVIELDYPVRVHMN